MIKKFTLSDLAVFLFSIGFLVWESYLSHYFPAQNLFRLGHDQIHWKFIPQEGQVIDPVAVNIPLSNYNQTHCCDGTYIGTVSHLPFELTSQVDQGVGLFLSSVAGFSGLKMNHQSIPITANRSYSNLGPIIVLPLQLLSPKEPFEIEIAIQGGPRGGYTGFFREPPVMGSMLALSEFRDARVAYIKNLPLAFSLIYITLAGLFFWLSVRLKFKDPVCHEFIFALIIAAIYYLFISGVVRTYAADWSMIVHFPTQIILLGLVFRLLATFALVPKKHIQYATCFYLFGAFIGYILNFSNLLSPVYLLNILGRISLIYPIVYFARQQRSPLQNTLFLTALPACAFIFSDAILILSRVFPFHYPIGLRDRQISPFILLSSLVYLVHQLSESVLSKLRKKAWEEVAAQVVHDIRSPLAALQGISCEQFPKTEQMILSTVTQRIQDMISALTRPQIEPVKSPLNQNDPVRISELIESLMTEKQFQFRAASRVQMQTYFDPFAPTLFAQLHPGEFKRILSNLINNAIESSPDSIQVNVVLAQKQSYEKLGIEVKIQDNGPGISREVLKTLGERGVTYGKNDGQGLGLWHAKTLMLTWGGTLQIHSILGQGTEVVLTLPQAEMRSQVVMFKGVPSL